MNNAQLTGIRNLHESTITIRHTDCGWEVRRAGVLAGVFATIEGAREMASLLA